MRDEERTLWDRAHRAGVIRHDTFPEWIGEVCGTLDARHRYGRVFLFNISFESLEWNLFNRLWLQNYGRSSPVRAIHVITPVQSFIPRDGKDAGRLRYRLAEWLNPEYLRTFAELAVKYPSEQDALRSVCEKTYFTLVDLEKDWLKGVKGEYAFAAYLSETENGSALDQLAPLASYVKKHPDAPEDEYPPDVKSSLLHLAKSVELILGAGIREPFSTRTGLYYKYNLILPIYPYNRSGQRGIARRCVIKEHLKTLARLWSEKSDPMEAGDCDVLRSLGDDEERSLQSLRMDRFMAWSNSGVLENGEVLSEFPLAVGCHPFLRVVGAPEFAADREPEITNWLDSNDAVDLSEYRFPYAEAEKHRLYHDHTASRASLQSEFTGALENDVIQMLSGKAFPKKNYYPVFLLSGASGTGKTEMIEEMAAHLHHRPGIHVLAPKVISCQEKPAASLAEEAWSFVNSIKPGRVAFLVFDEAQSATPFNLFVSRVYNVADQYKQHRRILVTAYITSDTLATFTRRVEAVPMPDKRKDFHRRLTHRVEMPTPEIGDLLLVALDALQQRCGSGVRVNKAALAFLLLRSTWLPSIREIIDSVNSLDIQKKGVVSVGDVARDAAQVMAFRKRFAETSSRLMKAHVTVRDTPEH